MKKQSHPTIFDLVDHTGISRGSISRAFNNQAGIKPSMKEKILRDSVARPRPDSRKTQSSRLRVAPL